MPEILVRISSADLFRMIGWLLAGIALYAASMTVGADYPQFRVILQKLGNVTTFSWIGYWISRGALGRLNRDYWANVDVELAKARACVIGAAIIAGALGL